eukprot:TRINITY_DN27409_c0_g1_i1.p1 TRINITY_DN27409_c0_g1~~TRINITY_DN27409_c0_g1_i1.p1  ORF type:complete len:249 (+),score=56.19 TRINITY_DN27409_c0_g1_i1:59-805(+)
MAPDVVRPPLVAVWALVAVTLHGCEKISFGCSGDSHRRSTASCFPGEFECTGEDEWCQEQKKRCDRYGADGAVRVSRSSCENGNFTCSGADSWCQQQREKCESSKSAAMKASCEDGVLECTGDKDWCAEQKVKCDNLKIASEIRSSRSSCKAGKFTCTGEPDWCAEQQASCKKLSENPMTASCKGGKFECEGDDKWCESQRSRCEGPPTKLVQVEPAAAKGLRRVAKKQRSALEQSVLASATSLRVAP